MGFSELMGCLGQEDTLAKDRSGIGWIAAAHFYWANNNTKCQEETPCTRSLWWWRWSRGPQTPGENTIFPFRQGFLDPWPAWGKTKQILILSVKTNSPSLLQTALSSSWPDPWLSIWRKISGASLGDRNGRKTTNPCNLSCLLLRLSQCRQGSPADRQAAVGIFTTSPQQQTWGRSLQNPCIPRDKVGRECPRKSHQCCHGRAENSKFHIACWVLDPKLIRLSKTLHFLGFFFSRFCWTLLSNITDSMPCDRNMHPKIMERARERKSLR